MRGRRRELTLAGQFLLLQLGVVALLLLIVGVISVRQSTATFESERGPAMRSVAESLAAQDFVRSTLLAAVDGEVAGPEVARLLAPPIESGLSPSDATDVLVVSLDGVVLAASDPSLVGSRADLGDSDVLQGRGWVGNVEPGASGDGERAVAGHAPVYAVVPDASGSGTRVRLVGAVLAEQTYPSIGDRLTGAAGNLALYLGLGALLGVVGTYVVSRVVKRSTRGLAPTEIANLADHREALLHSIREGVVAVGTDGRVTMMNDAARVTLGVAADPVGRHIADLGLGPHVEALLDGAGAAGTDGADAGAGEVQDAVALVGGRVVVFNRRSASSRGRGIGSVTTLRDRTELLSLQSQLSSNLSITDTLRAQTHEFDNQLHTISGLVQLGEYDEVRTLVGRITRHRSEIGAFVSARLEDPALAALMIAKDAVAVERGVELVLDPGSRLGPLPAEVSADLTTVVGNLVDNAVDACAGTADAQVEVWVTEVDGDVHVRVRDNGPGVPDELRDAIFVRGFSTKPDVLGGRGIGLPLVQLICTQRGGRVEVDRAAEEGGAEFRVVLPRGVSAAAVRQGVET
ncbi:sensor histidine kinase [Nocardioides plantarum]|uniref:histidine kinase n=1 Tax=Nocardioides plantarum TaxID=29299 RepID=A0ABV5KAG9_9ACTN|nr:ATP-binding protein [Nocardioides plantarum]